MGGPLLGGWDGGVAGGTRQSGLEKGDRNGAIRPRRYSRLELVGAVVDRGGIVDKNRCRKGLAAVGRLRQLHVNPAVALNLKSEQHMAVGWVDGHVVRDAVTQPRVC